MSKYDEFIAANERHWQRMVEEGCGYTIPWLDLDAALLRQYARGELEGLPEPLDEIFPWNVFADVEGKDVLCLASGGGQQSAVFGLLGAHVTVVDLAEGQLDGDRRAAAHYRYEVTTIQGDMRDLSRLDDESFDLVYQAASMCYVPDVREVYSGVARVLRPGGLYRAGVSGPAWDDPSWDGKAYCIRITRPLTESIYRREDGAVEFGHYWSDVFNGLIENGFSIQQVQEAPAHWKHNSKAHPGSWEHMMMYIPFLLAIVARKEHRAF